MNIGDLQSFYTTPLGYVLRDSILQLIARVLPQLVGNSAASTSHTIDTRIIVYGYPLQTLNTDKIIITLPDHMGGLPWPQHQPRTVIVSEQLLPFSNDSIDYFIMIHGFEYSQNPQLLLAECHRSLHRDGRLLIIAPNRRSLWAHQDCTPLGHGRPYTMTQLERALNKSQFAAVSKMRALYTPPHNSDLVMSGLPIFEQLGPVLMSKLSGLVAIDAIKESSQIVAMVKPMRTSGLMSRFSGALKTCK